MHTAAAFITPWNYSSMNKLNQQLFDIKIYFTDVHNVFAFQKLLLQKSYICWLDSKDYFLSVKHKHSESVS